jgi:HEAT repeats
MQIAKCKMSIAERPMCNLQFAICILQLLRPFVHQLFAPRYIAGVWAVLALSAAAGSGARADVVELANGGRIEGRATEAADGDRSQYVIDLAAGGRLTIPRSQVARVETTSPVDAEYEKLARSSPDTVEAHWKLAEWCRERKLREPANQHMARVVELDPNHEKARAALGFRKNGGQWMTRDDVMATRGLVLYEGQYITPQHVELLQRQKETKVTQADWANKLERLRRSLTGRREDRAAEAHAEIQTITDPLAAEAVVAALRRERNPELRRLWIDVASKLDHSVTIEALVDLSLKDADPEIRHDCLEHLVRSGRPGLLTPYVRALKNRDNEIVNRAGAALGQIGDAQALGPLIEALVTRHTFKVSDANPDQHAHTFSSDGSAFSFGGSGPQVIQQDVRNPDVLSSLVTLSGGASFDYDQQQWRRWLAAQAKVNVIDVRRDD